MQINSTKIIILVLIILAILLRVIWLKDMEWKADEKLMVKLAEDALQNGLPAIGMPSGGGIPNAGFSIWPFALFFRLSGGEMGMVLLVAISNILAFFIWGFACKNYFKSKFTEVAIWGWVSFGISLLPVLFSRKIWAQDILSIFFAVSFWLISSSKFRSFSFLVGALVALSGQIHMSGFFYGAGIFIAAFIFKKYGWREMIIGAIGFIVGMLPAWGWMQYLLTENHGGSYHAHHVWKLEFWLHSMLDPLGINVIYSLEKSYLDFCKYYYFIPFLFAVIIVFIMAKAAIRFTLERMARRNYQISGEDKFLLFGFIVIPGILLTFSGIPVRTHYLIPAFPVLCYFMMKVIVKYCDKWKLVFITAQLIFTILFLTYVHNKSEVGGDYGATYRSQTEKLKK